MKLRPELREDSLVGSSATSLLEWLKAKRPSFRLGASPLYLSADVARLRQIGIASAQHCLARLMINSFNISGEVLCVGDDITLFDAPRTPIRSGVSQGRARLQKTSERARVLALQFFQSGAKDTVETIIRITCTLCQGVGSTSG